MESFNAYHTEELLGCLFINQLTESYAKTYMLMPTEEVKRRMDVETPVYQWKLDSRSAHHFNNLQSNPDAMTAVMNTIYEVAYKGTSPKQLSDEHGKPETGWAFKGSFTQPIWHSKPSKDFFDGKNPNNPRQRDPIALVWWRNGKNITFALWSHKEYKQNINRFKR